MSHEQPVIEFATPGPLREQLVEAVRAGTKTATSSLVREYEVEGCPLPSPGDVGTVIDSEGTPQFSIETVEVEVVPLRDVSLKHAVAEGEGFTSVAAWRAAHEAFWAAPDSRALLGEAFTVGDDTLVVLERFTLRDVMTSRGVAGSRDVPAAGVRQA